MVAKATIGFLHPLSLPPGPMLRSVIVGMRGFSVGNTMSVIRLMRHEISVRGVLEDLGSLGPYWRDQLAKCRWFRSAALFGGASTISTGVERSIPVLVGPPPRERFYDFVTSCAARLQRDNTEKWCGVKVVAHSVKLDRLGYRRSQRRINPSFALRRFLFSGFSWAFVWPRPLFEVLKNFPGLFDRDRGKWRDCHPFLTRRPRLLELGKVRKPLYPPPVSILPVWGTLTSEVRL
jgi:hypothetical protein